MQEQNPATPPVATNAGGTASEEAAEVSVGLAERAERAISQLTTDDLIFLSIELGLVLVAFVVVAFLLRRLLAAVSKMPAAKRGQPMLLSFRRNLRSLTVLLWFVSSVTVIAANVWLLLSGRGLRAGTLDYLRSIPSEVWTRLLIGAGQALGLALLVYFALRIVRRLLDAARLKVHSLENETANDEAIDHFFFSLTRVVERAAWLFVLAISLHLLGLPESVSGFAVLLVKVYLTIGLGIVIWRALDAVIESLDALSHRYSREDNLLRFYARFAHLVPLLRRALEWAIYVSVAGLVVMQIEPISPMASWASRIISIIGVLFLSRVFVEATSLAAEELLINRANLDGQQAQRRRTIVPIIQMGLKYAVYFCAAIIVLKQLGINPTPVLAGAGIVGLAVGLGAQNLINDLVSGFFILFEDYYLVGDFICVDDAEGFVEQIDLRTTRIRDDDGRLHIVRNGNIEKVLHYSKGYSVAVVELRVSYEANLDQVFDTLEAISAEMLESHPDVLEPSEIRGLEDFGESAMILEIETKVTPAHHLDVARDMRRRIKTRFDELGIRMPYAKRVLLTQDDDGGVVLASPTRPS